MATQRLTDVEREALRVLAQGGVPPCELAEQFHVSVSTVHNYKQRLKRTGVTLPSVNGHRRGYRRPSEFVPNQPVVMLTGGQDVPASLPGAHEDSAQPAQFMHVTIGGQTIEVDRRASTIRVEDGQLYVTY